MGFFTEESIIMDFDQMVSKRAYSAMVSSCSLTG